MCFWLNFVESFHLIVIVIVFFVFLTIASHCVCVAFLVNFYHCISLSWEELFFCFHFFLFCVFVFLTIASHCDEKRALVWAGWVFYRSHARSLTARTNLHPNWDGWQCKHEEKILKVKICHCPSPSSEKPPPKLRLAWALRWACMLIYAKYERSWRSYAKTPCLTQNKNRFQNMKISEVWKVC